MDEQKAEIIYNENRRYDLLTPKIMCPYISAPAEWEKMYSDELKKETKRTGTVSYVTYLSLDHKDTKKGDKLTIEVSSCDYLAHNVNSKYLAKHPNDWERIKGILKKGELDEYFSNAMPGNVFVNYIVINGQTNNVLAIKRSNQELNARNLWGLSGFETMNDVANAANGSLELKLRGIVERGLWEELAMEEDEVAQMAISNLSFVKHLGIMVTALVRVDLIGAKVEKSNNIGNVLTEGGFIERVLKKSKSRYEHSDLKWLPIKLNEMKSYIENESGFYNEVIKTYDGNEAKWIRYAKLQMYQIWFNHDCIDIVL